MILDPWAASIMSAVGEIEHELGTMEALLAPPRDPGHLARWNAGLSELKSGLDIMTRLAHDIETGVK